MLASENWKSARRVIKFSLSLSMDNSYIHVYFMLSNEDLLKGGVTFLSVWLLLPRKDTRQVASIKLILNWGGEFQWEGSVFGGFAILCV